MPKSIIFELNESGNIERKAEYTTEPKQALINYVMQFKKNNFNTWDYPKELNGIVESKKAKDHFYYDYENIVIASYPA